MEMDKTGFNSSAQRQTAVTGTMPTTGIMVSCAEECTDERVLARAVVRAEAILVASRSLSATFCLCFFLYFSVGSHSCGCSASTVSFRVECDEGSAMTGTLLASVVLQCARDVGRDRYSSEYDLQ